MTSHPDTVLVTGAGGFVGSALTAKLLGLGWRVIAAGRSGPTASNGAAEYRYYNIADGQISPRLLAGVNVVIHAACARQREFKNSYALNVSGTQALANAARSRNIHVVFISSLAAHGGALSEYGKQKWEIEKGLVGRAGIVRPGLVIGDGGLFGDIRSYISTHHIVPIVDAGRQPLQTVFIDDLVAVVVEMVRTRQNVRVLAAETPAITYTDFFRAIRRRFNLKVAFIPLPARALSYALSMARVFALSLPIDEENLLGLLAMRSALPPEGGLLPEVRIRAYEESLESLR